MACSAKEAVVKARNETHNIYDVEAVFDYDDSWIVSWLYPVPSAGGTPSYMVNKETGDTTPFEPTLYHEHYDLAKKYYERDPIDRSLWEE